jgi:hypothetical protein
MNMAQVISNVGQNEYLPYKPIQFLNGAPTGQDYAEVGHTAVDVLNNVGYMAGNQVNGLQTWFAVGAATGVATTAMTISPGNLVVSQGNETITAGNLVVSAGSIAATVGAITAGTTVTAGTSIAATTSIVAGTTVTTTNGNFIATAAGTGLKLGVAGPTITCGTGDPNGVVTQPKASVYLNLTGSTIANRIWVNTNSGTVWTAVTTAA